MSKSIEEMVPDARHWEIVQTPSGAHLTHVDLMTLRMMYYLWWGRISTRIRP